MKSTQIIHLERHKELYNTTIGLTYVAASLVTDRETHRMTTVMLANAPRVKRSPAAKSDVGGSEKVTIFWHGLVLLCLVELYQSKMVIQN